MRTTIRAMVREMTMTMITTMAMTRVVAMGRFRGHRGACGERKRRGGWWCRRGRFGGWLTRILRRPVWIREVTVGVPAVRYPRNRRNGTRVSGVSLRKRLVQSGRCVNVNRSVICTVD